MRYYLEMIEDGHRLPTGDPAGYATLEEARRQAERHTDDALPRNRVRVCAHVATAFLGGDGEPYVKEEDGTPGPDPVGVSLFKASDLPGKPVPDLLIRARASVPAADRPDALKGLHHNNACRLGDALLGSLPGGTIDQLLVFLLEHRASVLRVPYRQE